MDVDFILNTTCNILQSLYVHVPVFEILTGRTSAIQLNEHGMFEKVNKWQNFAIKFYFINISLTFFY